MGLGVTIGSTSKRNYQFSGACARVNGFRVFSQPCLLINGSLGILQLPASKSILTWRNSIIIFHVHVYLGVKLLESWMNKFRIALFFMFYK